MKIDYLKNILMSSAVAGAVSCGTGAAPDLSSVQDAGDKVKRVEPLSWWTGMKTPLQLMVYGDGISEYDVRMEGGKGVKVQTVHKADSPNYLFVDVRIAENACIMSRDESRASVLLGKIRQYPELEKHVAECARIRGSP